MASVVKGVFTATTTAGDDIVISGLSTPVAILLWTTRQTSAAAADADGELYMGMATYDGAAAQQFYIGLFDADTGIASDTAKGMNTTACLKGYSAAAPTVDFEYRLVSMNGTSITIDQFDAPAAAIKVHYVVFQAPGFTKARISSFAGTVAGATQDVTVNAGFGVTNLLFTASHSTTTLGDSTNARMSFGWSLDATHRYCVGQWQADASAAMNSATFSQPAAAVSMASGTGYDGEADRDVPNDPTDGFRLSWRNQLAAAHLFCFCALQGPAQLTSGVNTAPITGTPPVVKDNACGFAPVGGLFMGDNLASHVTVDSSGADVSWMFLGATDGTNQGLGGNVQDDANVASFTGKVHSETKAIANYLSPGVAGAPTLLSIADGLISGNNLRESWTTVDTVAREHGWLAIGDPVTAAGIPDVLTARRR